MQSGLISTKENEAEVDKTLSYLCCHSLFFDLPHSWEGQAIVEGPSLDFSELSNPLLKPPSSKQRDVLTKATVQPTALHLWPAGCLPENELVDTETWDSLKASLPFSFSLFFFPTHTDLYHLYFIISKWHISSLINNQEDAINQNLSIITCARGKFSFPAGINWKFLPCKWEGRPSKRNICQQAICCSTTLHPFCCHSQSFLNVQVGHL